jgi:exoribonuclease-2
MITCPRFWDFCSWLADYTGGQSQNHQEAHVLFVLFEEAGKFLAGRILSEADSSLQVELDSGKRVKVKAVNALMRFEKPSPAEFVAAGQKLSEDIELDLAWEFASEDEFSFADLARDYFSADPSKPASLEQQAAALFCLFNAPHYFRRAGKGRFRKAPPEILQLALAAIEKKKLIALQITAWAEALAHGQCPEPIREQLYKILFKPDKNSAEYKAVVEASRSTHTAPLDLLQKAGAIASPYQFHYKRFLFENFPKGTGFPALQAPLHTETLPLAEVRAFSIDDSSTTEIDDALSVSGLGTGTVTLGIHIAAPGLAVLPGSPVDALGRSRLSTVYMPGYKLTMLPDDVVQNYTLQEGRNCPAVSLYVTLDETTLEIRETVTRLEMVHIASNLRHDVLDSTFTEAFFDATESIADSHRVEWATELIFLHRLARQLKAGREVARGKPENFNRPDYNFKLDNPSGQAPQGHETVSITTRQRGAPLDLIVSEAMILANSTWGLWLAEHGVPGIYRSQASLAPGVKVRMGTKALPHAGLGVKSYAWSTSPLRRYTDLVNQWQIIACAKHGRTAALAAPFKPKDAALFAIISGFDEAYSAYNGFQSGIERYWTLKYLQQNGITELTATSFKDNLVRADELPLVLPALGAMGLPRGARVRVRLGEIDEITLDISGTVIERLDMVVETSLEGADEDEEGEDMAAGPILIAVDVNEPTADAAGSVTVPA